MVLAGVVLEAQVFRMYYQSERATCSVCGRVADEFNGQDYNQWMRLTRNSLAGAMQVKPGWDEDAEFNYYLCPKCQKDVNLDFWKLFRKSWKMTIDEVTL